jgi:hypothetical protein
VTKRRGQQNRSHCQNKDSEARRLIHSSAAARPRSG